MAFLPAAEGLLGAVEGLGEELPILYPLAAGMWN